jgi:hypothetical protein
VFFERKHGFFQWPENSDRFSFLSYFNNKGANFAHHYRK